MKRPAVERRVESLRGLGLVAILSYALYGAYIASLYVLAGDKGGMRSADFVLFLVAVLFLVTTDLGRQLIARTLRGGARLLLLGLMVYMSAMLILAGGGTSVFNVEHLFAEIGKYFFVGFVAFAALRSRVYPLSRIAALSGPPTGQWRLAAVSTVLFLAAMVWFLVAFAGTSLRNLGAIAVISNDYYQEFGDCVTIAYCCLIALQVSYVKTQGGSPKVFSLFAALLCVQAVLVFLAAQSASSNKTVLTVALISAAALHHCWPRRRAIIAGLSAAASVVVLLLVARLAMIASGVSGFDATQFRLFDYGDSPFYQNSSVLSRWELFREYGMNQLLGAPLLGDISITSYQHSSVLSVQTHLGLMGAVMFWGFILLQLRRVYRYGGNDGLRVIALPLLVASAISSFFTWAPLWFLVGALFEYSSVRHRRLSTADLQQPLGEQDRFPSAWTHPTRAALGG